MTLNSVRSLAYTPLMNDPRIRVNDGYLEESWDAGRTWTDTDNEGQVNPDDLEDAD